MSVYDKINSIEPNMMYKVQLLKLETFPNFCDCSNLVFLLIRSFLFKSTFRYPVASPAILRLECLRYYQKIFRIGV